MADNYEETMCTAAGRYLEERREEEANEFAKRWKRPPSEYRRPPESIGGL